ncbi:MAG: MarR family transcriptional regulator [Clostridiales bacterium]|nr:MarR family transcriptional regulator [Clostridiales bacterium]
MNKTIDERLFERLMKAPRQMRMMLHPQGGPEWKGPHGCHGPNGHGQHGHGPCGGPGHGPHGHGPCGGPGHDPHGHGPCGGPHGEHGPHGLGHRARMRTMRMLSRERILGILLEHEDGLRQKAISEQMHIGPSSTSEFIDKLEQTGYIDRRPDPDDGRATRIYLTEKGRARAYELEDERKERFAALFAALTDEEKEQLLALLDKLAAAYESAAE